MWALVLIVSLLAQLEYARPQIEIAGIVEAPELFGEYACDRFVPEPIDVYEAPSSGSPRVGVLETTRAWYSNAGGDCDSIEVVFRDAATGVARELRFREYSYEFMGLVVAEATGDWLRIASRGDIGWIESRQSDRYHSYEELIGESLSYLTDRWNGGLWAAPGVGDPEALPPAWDPHLDEPIVEVLESRRVEGNLWFRVRLDAEYGCGTLTGALPAVEGWVAGYRQGAPQIWFHARGC